MSDFFDLITEQVNAKSRNIDLCSTREIVEIINSEDKLVAEAVADEIDRIAAAVDVIAEHIKEGGRLFYVGAGSCGRIGILDASECPPTFGTNPEMVQGIIAGGEIAVLCSVEGVEDNEQMGREVISQREICRKDVLIGITASGRTPFVLGAIRKAREAGIFTIGISNNTNSIIKEESDIAITPLVGPEVIMGSTRMKAGTSQKLVLNMITTSVMIKLGKVYGNLMVDLQPVNRKLVDRAMRILMHALSIDQSEASTLLELSGFNPKAAILMKTAEVSKEEAERLLKANEGFVARAVKAGLTKD